MPKKAFSKKITLDWKNRRSPRNHPSSDPNQYRQIVAKAHRQRWAASSRFIAEYNSCHDRDVALGRKFAERLAGGNFRSREDHEYKFDERRIPKEHNTENVKSLAMDMVKDFGGLTKEQFKSRYRNVWDAHDEFVSTGFVYAFLEGVSSASKRLNETQIEAIASFVADASSLRMKTSMVGFNLRGGESMQHPTREGDGYFSRKRTEGRHAELDIKRRKFINKVADSFLNRESISVEGFTAAVGRAALEVTLDLLVAPAEAMNIFCFRPRTDVQTRERDRFKSEYKRRGGTLREMGGLPWQRPNAEYDRGDEQQYEVEDGIEPRGRSLSIERYPEISPEAMEVDEETPHAAGPFKRKKARTRSLMPKFFTRK